jgi:large subunit ribosomal protein L18
VTELAHGPRYSVPYRRRREGRTNYRSRLALLKSGIPRAVVRRSRNLIRVQFIEYEPTGDRVLASVDSRMLKTYGWTAGRANTASAYLTGYLAGRKALESGVEEAVLDIGVTMPTKGSRMFAVLKGLVDAGVYIPHSDEALTPEERITGIRDGALRADYDKTLAKMTKELGAPEAGSDD